MSCNWRPDLERCVRDETSLEFRGVKKRVKRLGVMGGGRFGLREQTVADEGGGGDEPRKGQDGCVVETGRSLSKKFQS